MIIDLYSLSGNWRNVISLNCEDDMLTYYLQFISRSWQSHLLAKWWHLLAQFWLVKVNKL